MTDDEEKSEHVQLLSTVETTEIKAGDFAEHEEDKYDKVDIGFSIKLWDELALKKHGLVTKSGDHDHVHPDNVAKKRMNDIDNVLTVKPDSKQQVSRLPFDEIAMKRSGFVDNHAHHLTEADINKDDENGDNDSRHVVLRSSVDAITVTPGSGFSTATATSPSSFPKLSPNSNQRLLETYQNAFANKPNLLNQLKVKQEYVEQREGNEGGAVVSWPNGTKDVYELKFSGVRHVGRIESNREFESDAVDNPWIEYEVLSQEEESTETGRSERSPSSVKSQEKAILNEMVEEDSKPNDSRRLSAFQAVNESKSFSGIQPNPNQLSPVKTSDNSNDNRLKISGQLDVTVDDGKGNITKKILYFKKP